MAEVYETSISQTNEYRGEPAEEVFTTTLPDNNIIGTTFMQIVMASSEEANLINRIGTITEIIQQAQIPECYKMKICIGMALMDDIIKLKDEYEHTNNKTSTLKKIMLMSLDIAKEAINYMAPGINEDTTYSLSSRVAHDPRVESTPRFEP